MRLNAWSILGPRVVSYCGRPKWGVLNASGQLIFLMRGLNRKGSTAGGSAQKQPACIILALQIYNILDYFQRLQGGPMPVVQRPYIPPEDQVPQEESFAKPGDNRDAGAPEDGSLEPITFYSDSMHIFSSLYSAVLFFGEQMEEREPILRARIKVSPQMLKAISLLTAKHVREYENAVGPITLPEQVYAAWELNEEGEAEHAAG